MGRNLETEIESNKSTNNRSFLLGGVALAIGATIDASTTINLLREGSSLIESNPLVNQFINNFGLAGGVYLHKGLFNSLLLGFSGLKDWRILPYMGGGIQAAYGALNYLSHY